MKWEDSDWEKLYEDQYKIVVIDPGRIVVIIPSEKSENPCWAINAGIKEVARTYIIKSITSVQEKIDWHHFKGETFNTGSHSTEIILLIEPKILGQD